MRRESGKLYLRLYSPIVGEKYISLRTDRLDNDSLAFAQRLRDAFYYALPEYRPQTYKQTAELCWNEHFENPDKPKRANTKRNARRSYDLLVKAFGNLGIGTFTDDTWREQLRVWRVVSERKAYRHVRVYAIQIDRFAANRGFKRERLSFPLTDPKPREGIRVSEKQFDRIINAAGQLHRSKSRRDTILFLTMARRMGMRKNEILGLTWDRVDLREGVIRLGAEDVKTGSRTGRGREISIAPHVMPLLIEQARYRRNAFVFSAYRHNASGRVWDLKSSLGKISELVGFGVRAHDLRHSFLSEVALERKVDPLSISTYAGVSLDTIERVYLHPRASDTQHVVWQVSEKKSDSQDGKKA